MNYNKILKLASYFRSKNQEVYFDILKLAWDHRFLSLVLGCYPSRSGNENESKTRRLNVARLINDPSKTEYTISEMANIINDEHHKDIGEQNQSEIWKDYLSPSQLSELIKLVSGSSPVEPQRGSVNNGQGTSLDIIFSKLSVIKKYHDSIRIAVADLWKNYWNVPRSSGPPTKSWIKHYNPATKQARFTVGYEKGSELTKDVSLEYLLSENKNNENKSLEWLARSEILPFSIYKSNGGRYNGCLLKDVRLEENKIICNFEFIIGEFDIASKEVWFDATGAAKFYEMNSTTLDRA
jgi:hypothetical protein